MSDVDDSLEELLGNAEPRTVPDAVPTAIARQVVRAEWQTVTGKRRVRRRTVIFATAATVLLVVFSALNSFRVPTAGLVQVAAIQKSFGSISFVSEQSIITPADNLTTIHSGQKIATGNDGGIALAWGSGGSLRVAANTTVEFVDEQTVYLHEGQIYFDSTPSAFLAAAKVADAGAFEIETVHGLVSHVGTQFMTAVHDDELRVSVREGRVDVDGKYYPRSASRGDQVVFSGRQRPVVLSISTFGDDWNWIEKTSPTGDVDGKTINEFLTWVGRELGREIVYDTEAVKQLALQDEVRGRVDNEPEVALRLRMLTTPLAWQFDEGTIYVSNNHSNNKD